MKILIFGASGSGSTTLGKALSKGTAYIHLDADDYYWKPTDPPFQEKVALTERNTRISADFRSYTHVILSGSMVSWGNAWLSAFDLAVFLYLPPAIRMERLRKREQQRYGSKLFSDISCRHQSKAFLDWAGQYDDPAFSGRSLQIHQQWMEQLTCPVLKLEGEMEIHEKVSRILAEISML